MSATSEFYYRHILLYRELVTEEELQTCARIQDEARARGETEPLLTDLLVEYGYLSPSQLQRLEAEVAALSDEQRSGYTGPRVPGYKIDSLQSENATGYVYVAQQKNLRRNATIKVLNPQFLTDRKAVDQYYAEAAAAAKVGHPNIVQLIDLGFDPTGSLYVVRERVEGESVGTMLERLGKFEPDDAATLVLGVARGLAYIHRIGIVHGHIRPNNILVPPDRIAKLQDLGLSRNVPESAESSGRRRILGHPLYMSPEQIRGDAQIDGGSDIYSLGATFYHMVVGRPPFVAATPKEVFDLHRTQAPVPPHKLVPAIPIRLSRIIHRMLAKTAEERYPSADALSAELENYCRRRARQTAAGNSSTAMPAVAAGTAPAVVGGGAPSLSAPTTVPAGAPQAAAAAPGGGISAGAWFLLAMTLLANLGLLYLYLKSR